jgi:hypothetical protein
MNETITQQWRLNKRARRLIGNLEMVHTISGYTGQIYRLVSALYTNEASKPGYRLYIFDSVEATTKWLESQSGRGSMVEVIQQMAKMLRQFNPFAESHKRMHQMKRNN